MAGPKKLVQIAVNVEEQKGMNISRVIEHDTCQFERTKGQFAGRKHNIGDFIGGIILFFHLKKTYLF